jgi:hypothetical protein
MAGLTLMDVVNEWLASKGKPENQRARLYTIALSGLREMHLDVNGIIKIVELCINDNDTVDLPNDFINYRKIGIAGADGRIHTLGRDNRINMAPACGLDGRIIQPGNNSDIPFYGLPFSGSFMGLTDGNGGVFGIGGGNNSLGYYRFNRQTGQLWLSNLGFPVGCTIIVEYIADISNGDGEDFIVHPYIVQTIKDWMSWQYIFDDKNSSLGDKNAKRFEYFNSLRISKNRYGSSSPEEWAQALRASNSATVRF